MSHRIRKQPNLSLSSKSQTVDSTCFLFVAHQLKLMCDTKAVGSMRTETNPQPLAYASKALRCGERNGRCSYLSRGSLDLPRSFGGAYVHRQVENHALSSGVAHSLLTTSWLPYLRNLRWGASHCFNSKKKFPIQGELLQCYFGKDVRLCERSLEQLVFSEAFLKTWKRGV